MTIEIRFNSIVLQYEDMETFPFVPSEMGNYLSTPPKRKHSRRRRKRKQTVGSLIEPIIDSINEK